MKYLNVSGRKIKQLREAKDMSQEELALLLCKKGRYAISKDIKMIEEGFYIVHDFDLMLLSEIFEVDILSLIEPKDFENKENM